MDKGIRLLNMFAAGLGAGVLMTGAVVGISPSLIWLLVGMGMAVNFWLALRT